MKSLNRISIFTIPLFLSGCISIINIPGNVVGRVTPNQEEAKITLRCEESSSGRCYFLLGANFDIVHDVKVEETISIPAPQAPLPLCVTFSLSTLGVCDQKTMIRNDDKHHLIFNRVSPR